MSKDGVHLPNLDRKVFELKSVWLSGRAPLFVFPLVFLPVDLQQTRAALYTLC